VPEQADPFTVDARSVVDQLTIARGMARAHNGDIFASSVGRGHEASFTLTMP
jgi:signal transduction histidine kinase